MEFLKSDPLLIDLPRCAIKLVKERLHLGEELVDGHAPKLLLFVPRDEFGVHVLIDAVYEGFDDVEVRNYSAILLLKLPILSHSLKGARYDSLRITIAKEEREELLVHSFEL